MVARSLLPFALGALAWISTPAAAGSCGPPCVAPVPVVQAIPVVVQPASYVTPIYIVNSGTGLWRTWHRHRTEVQAVQRATCRLSLCEPRRLCRRLLLLLPDL